MILNMVKTNMIFYIVKTNIILSKVKTNMVLNIEKTNILECKDSKYLITFPEEMCLCVNNMHVPTS